MRIGRDLRDLMRAAIEAGISPKRVAKFVSAAFDMGRVWSEERFFCEGEFPSDDGGFAIDALNEANVLARGPKGVK